MKHIYAIMAVFFVTALATGGSSVFAQETQETRVYDVSFLNNQERIYEEGIIGLNAGNSALPADFVPMSGMNPEFLFEMLRPLVKEDMEYFNITGTGLEVSATPAGHKAIAGAIAAIKAVVSKRIEVSAWLVCVDSGVLDAIKAENAKLNTAVISEKQFGMLKSAGKWAEQFELVLNDGQRGVTYSSRQISFTGDYDALLSQGVSAYLPIIEKYYEGVRLQAVPFVMQSGNMIRLDIRLSHSNLMGDIEKFKTGYCGDIELPEEDELEMATSVIMQDGAVVMAGAIESSVHAGRESIILLVHCRATGDNAKSKGFMSITAADGGIFSLYDARALFAPITAGYGFPFGNTELNDVAAYSMPPFEDMGNGTDVLLEKIKFTVGEGENDIFSLDNTQNFLIFKIDKDRTVRVDSMMKEQEAVSHRMVSVEAVYCKLPQQLYNDTIAPVDRPKRAALILDAVSKNSEFKLASCSIQGYNKHVFGLHRLDNKRIVSGNDVQVGAGVFAYDPVVETVSQGAALQVLPSIIEDGRKTGLDLNAAFRKFDKPMNIFETRESGSRYYQPAISEYKLNTMIVLENNVWDYAVLPSASVKDKEYVFILLKASAR